MSRTVQAAPRARDLVGEHSATIARLAPWFHNVHLPNGEQTAPNHPLGDFPRWKWEQVATTLPEDLTGATVLDIGCNAGFYSIELARRGAQVMAIDHDARYLRQAAWAAGVCGVRNRIQLFCRSVYQLQSHEREFPESFDIVLFMGVLYHLRYPLLGLDIAASRTRELLVFQTLTTPDDGVAKVPEDLSLDERNELVKPGWPRMSFVEGRLASDPTNWWVPNAACCEAMLRVAGLEVLERPGHEIYVCRPRRDREEDDEDAATGIR